MTIWATASKWVLRAGFSRRHGWLHERTHMSLGSGTAYLVRRDRAKSRAWCTMVSSWWRLFGLRGLLARETVP